MRIKRYCGFQNFVRKNFVKYPFNRVVPKLGAMAPPGGQGAIAREPWAHIEKINFSRIDTEIWTFGLFGIFYPLKCNILEY